MNRKYLKKKFIHCTLSVLLVAILMVTLSFYDFKSARKAKADITLSSMPEVELKTLPEGMISPNVEVALQASAKNFADFDKISYSYCLDTRPLNGLLAGSEDELITTNSISDEEKIAFESTKEIGETKSLSYSTGSIVKNNYGEIKGGAYACNPAAMAFAKNNFAAYRYGVVANEEIEVSEEAKEAYEFRYPDESPEDRARKYLTETHYYCGNLAGDECMKEIISGIYITRESDQEDSDNDGLPDQWEIDYFAGRLIPGSNPPEYYPSQEDKASLLAAVSPDDDSDNDGEELWGSVYSGENKDGETVAAYHEHHMDEYSYAFLLGIPYVKNEKKSTTYSFGYDDTEGLTNYEEFVFGTDPLNSDTDGDGILDGTDITGLKGQSLSFVVNKKVEDKYIVLIRVFGQSQYSETNPDEYEDKGGDTSISKKFTRVQLADKLVVTVGKGFQLILSHSPELVTSRNTGSLEEGKEKVTILAVPSLYEGDVSELNFRWYLNGAYKENQSGQGKNEFQFSAEGKSPCDKHRIGVFVLNKETGMNEFKELEVFMGAPLTLLVEELLGNVTGSGLEISTLSDLEDRLSSTSISDLAASFLFDPQKDGVNFDIGKLRKGDVVKILADFDEDLNENLCQARFGDDFNINNFYFLWTFDGKESVAQSGSFYDDEKDLYHNFAYFITSKAGRDIGESASETSLELGDHTVSAKVYYNDQLFAEANTKINTYAPYLGATKGDLSEGFDIGGDVEMSSSEAGTTYKVKSGKTVEITAYLNYFRPSSNESQYTYTWTRNGQEVSNFSTSEETSTISFTAGESGTETVALNVVNSLNTEETEEATYSISIDIESEKPTVVRTAGRILGFIPKYFKNLFNFVFLAGIVGLVVLILIKRGEIKLPKKKK